MTLLRLESWPVWVVCLALIVAAINNYRTLNIKNALTLPLVLSGWALGALHSLDRHPDAGTGGLGASLAGTALALLLLSPCYALGILGAGTIKLQMGFGAWAGAFYGLEKGALIVLVATLAAALSSGLMYWLLVARSKRQRLESQLAGLEKHLSTASADESTPSTWQLLPTGIPQCAGAIIAILVLHSW